MAVQAQEISSVSYDADEGASEHGSDAKRGGMMPSLKALSSFSMSFSSKASTPVSLEADAVENGAAGKLGGVMQRLKTISLFSRSWSSKASEASNQRGMPFIQRNTETRTETRTVSFDGVSALTRVASFERSALPNETAGARCSALQVRVQSMRAQIDLDTRANDLRTSFGRTKSIARRAVSGNASVPQRPPSGEAGTRLEARRASLPGLEPPSLADFDDLGHTVFQRMLAQQGEKEITANALSRRGTRHVQPSSF